MRYEAVRREGLHHGPPLQAIRLYLLYRSPDGWARNIDRPDRKELIFEVMGSVKNESKDKDKSL